MPDYVLFLLVAAVGVAIWWWGRQPFHHRGWRPGQFPSGFTTLIREADGGRMFVEDEHTLRSIVVEKTYSDKDEIRFALRTKSCENEAGLVQRWIQERELGALEVSGDSIEVAIRCKRPTDGSDACTLLRLMFESLGSTATSTYHVYFDAKSDQESARGRLEEIASDPNASSFRKQAAALGLKKLDKRLAQKKRPS